MSDLAPYSVLDGSYEIAFAKLALENARLRALVKEARPRLGLDSDWSKRAGRELDTGIYGDV